MHTVDMYLSLHCHQNLFMCTNKSFIIFLMCYNFSRKINIKITKIFFILQNLIILYTFLYFKNVCITFFFANYIKIKKVKYHAPIYSLFIVLYKMISYFGVYIYILELLKWVTIRELIRFIIGSGWIEFENIIFFYAGQI